MSPEEPHKSEILHRQPLKVSITENSGTLPSLPNTTTNTDDAFNNLMCK